MQVDKVGQTGSHSFGKEHESPESDLERPESERDRTFPDAQGDDNECI
jgi:hypothetical protein